MKSCLKPYRIDFSYSKLNKKIEYNKKNTKNCYIVTQDPKFREIILHFVY